MAEIEHRTVRTNGITLHLAEAGTGPLVLLLHGWPESWYSWRHQLTALADAGYHAVAPDVRGYGRSDAPPGVEAYSMKEMVADCVGLLDALDEETAIIAGHDWGAPMAWVSSILHPHRYRAVIGLSVPYTGRAAAPPLELLGERFANNFFYINYFQEPGVAERELEADPKRSLRLILYAASGEADRTAPGFALKAKDATLLEGIPEPAQLPSWLSEQDLDYYAGEFARMGFRGAINRYRNIDRDWHELPELATARVSQPALFIYGEHDGVVTANPTSLDQMRQAVPGLRGIVCVRGAGHWTQQERPDEVNAAMIEFLKGL